MLLNIFQKELYQGIQIVQRAVSAKSTLPILTGIYLEAKKERGLHLIATDLEIGIEYWVKADIKEEGAIVLPADQLTGIIRELPAADIHFEVDPEHYRLYLKCLNSEFNIKGYQPDEFPQLPEVDQAQRLSVPADIFKEMVDEVKFSTSTDQTQPSLTGGLMAISREDIRLVTTNTYRLAYSRHKLENDLERDILAILPGGTLNELSNLIVAQGEIEIIINDNYVCFNINDIVLISRLIEGNFPNYQQVIPKEYNTRLKVDRDELLKAVKRTSLIARLDSNVISLSVKTDEMNITTVDSDSGDAHESLEIELEGAEQKINIDAGYLLDVLKVLKDDVVIMEMIGPLNPLTIKKSENDNYIYLIMPVRPGS